DERASVRREVVDIASADFLDARDEELVWNEPEKLISAYHGVILGGSGEFDFDGGRPLSDEARIMSQTLLARLTPLLTYIFSKDIPTLGICYGHQIIGAFRGARVHFDATQRKIGSHMVSREGSSEAHPL